MENFRVHIEQQFLSLADKAKQLHELDPLKISINQIENLPANTKIFADDERQEK